MYVDIYSISTLTLKVEMKIKSQQRQCENRDCSGSKVDHTSRAELSILRLVVSMVAVRHSPHRVPEEYQQIAPLPLARGGFELVLKTETCFSQQLLYM